MSFSSTNLDVNEKSLGRKRRFNLRDGEGAVECLSLLPFKLSGWENACLANRVY